MSDNAPNSTTAHEPPEQLHPVVAFLTEHHLFDFGGYPYPGRWEGDTFFWCDHGYSDDDLKRAEIGKITRAEMDEWQARAEQWAAENGYGSPPGDMGYPQDGNWIDYDFEPFRETEDLSAQDQ